MKTFLARWIANRNQVLARSLRRSLRDYQRREYASITALEERSRGLRLYAAWTGKKEPLQQPRGAGALANYSQRLAHGRASGLTLM